MADIYRKSSLEKLSSPEQLDKMIKITSPSLWISFIGIIIALTAVIVWSIFGKLPENLQISGIYSDSNTTAGVFAGSSGMVTDLNVEVGANIKEGDVIGKLQNYIQENNLELLKSELIKVKNMTLESKNDISTSNTSPLLEIKSSLNSADVKYNSAKKQLELCEKTYKEQELLVNQLKKEMENAEDKYLLSLDNDGGMVTFNYQKVSTEYNTALSKYESCSATVKKYELMSDEERESLDSQYQQAVKDYNDAVEHYNEVYERYLVSEAEYKEYLNNESNSMEKQNRYSNDYSMASSYYNNAYGTLLSYKSEIDSLKLNVELEKNNLEISTKTLKDQFESTKEATINNLQVQINEIMESQKYVDIVSSCSGTVIGIYVQNGQSVSQGIQLLKIKKDEIANEDNFIRCYVPLADAKKIKVGMEAIATPSTVDEQEYGHMIGKVEFVGQYTADTQDMLLKLGDEALVNSFQSGGPVIEIIISLKTDESTKSGYAWSNKKGSEVLLTENTYIGLKIVIDEQAPITKVIPTIKKWLKGESQSNTPQK